jgi:hypothetical protein
VICPGSIYRYRRLNDRWQFCLSLLNVVFVAGTFRPDRIRSIADRFGVNGDMALENILYGMLASIFSHSCLNTKIARAFNSEHQVETSSRSELVVRD